MSRAALVLVFIAVSVAVGGRYGGAGAANPKVVVIYAGGWNSAWAETGGESLLDRDWQTIRDRVTAAVGEDAVAIPFSYRYKSSHASQELSFPSYDACDTNQGLVASAAALGDLVQDAQARYAGARIVVVGHSEGGVVGAYWAGGATRDALKNVAAIVTLDSPLQGVGWQALAEDLGRLFVSSAEDPPRSLSGLVWDLMLPPEARAQGAAAMVANAKEAIRAFAGCSRELVDDLDLGNTRTFATIAKAPANLRAAGARLFTGRAITDLFVAWDRATVNGAEEKSFVPILSTVPGCAGFAAWVALAMHIPPWARPQGLLASAVQCVNATHGAIRNDRGTAEWVAAIVTDAAKHGAPSGGTTRPPAATTTPASSSTLLLPYDRGDTAIRFTGGPHALNAGPYCRTDASKMSGIDFARADGTGFEVLAASPGTYVGTFATAGYGAGYWAMVEHDDGTDGEYWHLDKVSTDKLHADTGLVPGQHIPQGYPIGWAGRSGEQDAVHLHLEIRRGAVRDAPYSGAPIPWQGQQIDGWTIGVHRAADGQGLSYQGSAVHGSSRNAAVTITEVSTPNGCGKSGTRTTLTASVSRTFNATEELNYDQSNHRIDANTVFAYTGAQAVSLPSTNCRRLNEGDQCSRNTPPPQTSGGIQTVFVMDVSDSMNEEGGHKILAARSAADKALAFIQQDISAGRENTVGLIQFNDAPEVLSELTANVGNLRVIVNDMIASGGTAIASALESALAQLPPPSGNTQQIVLLMTDGKDLYSEPRASQLAAQARSRGICIYTIAFGSDADETLLRSLADGAGCGEFSSAEAGGSDLPLRTAFVRARLQSAGELVLDNASGTLRQGEAKEVGRVTVAPGTGQLNATLSWPGSRADLVVTDPAGRVVDESYPGASISTTDSDVFVIVNNPAAGTWMLTARGVEVPEGVMPIVALVSTTAPVVTPAPTPPAPVGDGDEGALSPAIIAVLSGVGGAALLAVPVLVIVLARRGGRGPGAAFVVEGREVPVRAGPRGFTIGRGRQCDLVLDDTHASSVHARVDCEDGAFVLTDLQSRNGTRVHGQAVREARLYHGDQLEIGRTSLLFVEPLDRR